MFSEYSKSSAEEIGNLEVNEEDLSIDIDNILEIMHISVKKTVLDSHSGKLDSGNSTIWVNVTESPERKRFTKAHELGHFLLHHEGISCREDANIYNSKEREANNLAAKILMPEKLVFLAIELYQERKDLTDEELEQDDPMTFTYVLSKYLNVTMTAMKYRLESLGVLVDI